jgi:hypothetical protein
VRLAALFTDYDGTLAPGNVDRDDSRVPSGVERTLRQLSRLVPIAVITSKDLDFVRPRTRTFAAAWACTAGIEITMADGSTQVSKGVQDMRTTLIEVRKIVPEGVLIEEKWSCDGKVLGICVDWTSASGTVDERFVNKMASLLRRRGAYVDRQPQCTYLDAFAAVPDKGLALTRLKELLRINGPVLYMGDSMLDNAAFAKSDIAVGVHHGQPIDQLRCSFLIQYDSLERFLSSLLNANLEFSTNMMESLDRAERMR